MALASPSMVHRTGDTLVVRSVVSGDALFGTSDSLDPEEEKDDVTLTPALGDTDRNPDEDGELPQCKIKRNYACSKCSYYTQNPRFYLYHLKNVHKEKIKVYECPSCLYASKHSQKLQRHVHMVHVMGAGRRKAPPKPKPIAPKPTRPYTRRRQPAVVDSPKEKGTKNSAPKEFVDRPQLVDSPEAEGEGESETKAFSCSLCPFNSRSQTLVTRHERVVHLKKKFYRCVKCNYVTHMKARYTKHVKYHSMPMIKCDMCDFRTPYKWNLDRHNKNHQGDGVFKCSLCNFTADIKQSLTVHEMNHHVPPVGQAGPSKRRNRVGASDTLGLLDQEQSHEIDQTNQETYDVVPVSVVEHHDNRQLPNLKDINGSADASFLKGIVNKDNSESPKSKNMMKKPKTFTNLSCNELTVKLGEKVINPNEMLQHKNGSVYLKQIKCRFCSYRAAWDSEIARHELKVHGTGEKKKPPPRPIPNLIPIQNKPVGPSSNQPILKIPCLKNDSNEINKNASKPDASPLSEKDLNDICAKSCLNSSLKDFASVIGGAEVFQNSDNEMALAVSCGSSAFPIERKQQDSLSPLVDCKRSTSDVFKKKNASFFDKLKEKLMTGVNEGSSNLICSWCGHESKCLSEAVRHQKLHSGKGNGNSPVCNGNSLISGTQLSSTRCRHCRQRCKTSADLFVHLRTCIEANKKSNLISQNEEHQPQGVPSNDNLDETLKINSLDYSVDERIDASEENKQPHPMENKVFVWNNLSEMTKTNSNDSSTPAALVTMDSSSVTAVSTTPTARKTPPCVDDNQNNNKVIGIENSPGYGTVTSKNKSGSQGHNVPVPPKNEKTHVDHSLKKVYKCPHCSFWASTASRFHVHIVGHLNKKPFECSLCAYRSNWRWDITKHIRLKTVRDASHERARVLMTDETGRRNYSKYNKYLTLMKVHEPSAESSGSGRRTKSQHESVSPSDILQESSPARSRSLPALPKLTPAPAASVHSRSDAVNNAQQPLPLSHLRPIYSKPPPLQSSLGVKRSQDSNDPSDEPARKKLSGDGNSKKTMWKCKKCLFRDGDRSVVLAHVKEHYKNGGLSKNDGKTSSEENQVADCKQTVTDLSSGSQHQNEGEVCNDYDDQQSVDQNTTSSANNTDSSEHLKCPTCPYIGRSENDIAEHIYQYHGGEMPDDLFKCYFCPFYVSDKQKLIEHMNSHGQYGNPDSRPSRSGKVSQKKNYIENGEGDVSPAKRYKCSGCPYVSNSKSQFLYHKQFHRPRGAPFKCNMCSYNVTRRHLLHQHLRVHGIHVPTQRIIQSGCDETLDETLDTLIDIGPIDTSNLLEIPLVWVSKLGNLTKMFKCRYCPHVNIRKSNIQEHEKMHGQRFKPSLDGDSSPPAQQQQQHRCPDCNYVCNNAGVLSSHAKVHQGLFGQVCGLVDNSRSDEAQIKELNALLGRNEEGPPTITPDEIKKEPKHLAEYVQPVDSLADSALPEANKILRFCNICPARFLFKKELDIHVRFHSLNLSHRCESCSYTARQRPHLLAHYKVHADEYQDKTNALCNMYKISSDHPKPKIAVIVEGPSGVGPAWVVVPPPEYPKTPEELDEMPISNLDEDNLPAAHHGNRVVHKQYSCDKCPAQFFKSVALQYHLTLHGGTGRHKCRSCDYAVKTYGNLIKHEAVHEQLEPRVKQKPKTKKNEIAVPTSGTELFRQKNEAAQKVAVAALQPPPPPLHIDPEFGLLMHGSPEFVYPTYLKNGRLKEKRYKCHKCPSAFEKREQYKVHLSLHGSKQRYKCERCDYSVKYYANYIQHLRKHQSNDATKAERKLSTDRSSDEQGSEDIGESTDATSEEVLIPPIVIGGQRSAKSLRMSMADQQTLMLLQQRVVSNSVSAPEVLNRCPYCPYSNQRRDGVGSHVKCHLNGKTGVYTCRHCTYSVPQQHFLREHNKLHFTPIKGLKPEAYMKCDRLELWSQPVIDPSHLPNGETHNNKILVFKDKGNNYKTDRYLPALPPRLVPLSAADVPERKYVNLKTGEIESDEDQIKDAKEDNKENLVMNPVEEVDDTFVKEENDNDNDHEQSKALTNNDDSDDHDYKVDDAGLKNSEVSDSEADDNSIHRHLGNDLGDANTPKAISNNGREGTESLLDSDETNPKTIIDIEEKNDGKKQPPSCDSGEDLSAVSSPTSSANDTMGGDNYEDEESSSSTTED